MSSFGSEADRVRRVIDWGVVAAVAAFPLLTTEAAVLSGLDGRAYAGVVLAGAGFLGVLDVPGVCRRVRDRFGMPAVRSARALVVWALVAVAAAMAGPTGGLLFLLAVPVVAAAIVLPAVGTAGLVAASIALALTVGLPEVDWQVVWTVTIVGVGGLAGAGLRHLSGESRRRRRAQAQAARRAELLNVVATTSLASHGLGADAVVAAVVNGALGLGLRAAAVFEPDLQADVYRCREAVGLPAEVVEEVCPLDGTDAVGATVRSGRPVITVAGDGDEDGNIALPSSLAAAGFTSLWAVPVFVDDEVAAVLCVLDERRRRPDEGESVTLGILADRVGDALAHDRRVVLQRQAITRLREAERLKDDFVSTVSHELRTPATVIKAANELLFTRWEQLPAETRDQLRARIDAHADQLASLLDSLLAYRELDAGRMQPELTSVDVADLIGPVRRRVEARDEAETRPVAWQVDDVTVVADPDGIRRVMSILVDNALIHTPVGTRLTVAARRRDGQVRVTVSDDGPGIDPDQLAGLRRPFTRHGDVLTRDTRGLGLGLAIAELILHGHGRRLDIDSQPGAGTRCSFDLPIHRRRPEGAAGQVITLPEVETANGAER